MLIYTRYETPEAVEKKITDNTPDIFDRIEQLMRDDTAGDPMSGLKWTRRTAGNIAAELSLSGISVSPSTVGKILRGMGFSLKSNVKKIANGGKLPTKDEREKRNTQFEYIKEMRDHFENKKLPAISCDTKKKELIGAFKNSGTRLKREADLVNDHDFASYAIGKAAPYGILEISKNKGFVSIGKFPRDGNKSTFLSGDTPEFAVESIEGWYLAEGAKYDCRQLLVLVDSGGSNGNRCHMWKVWIQKILCNKHGLEVTVCHYPPGASKWNPVEHRLFSEISKSWRGVPLVDFDTVENYIKKTKTKAGLTVDSVVVEKIYEKNIKAGKRELDELNIQRHNTNGEWNYTIKPNINSELRH